MSLFLKEGRNYLPRFLPNESYSVGRDRVRPPEKVHCGGRHVRKYTFITYTHTERQTDGRHSLTHTYTLIEVITYTKTHIHKQTGRHLHTRTYTHIYIHTQRDRGADTHKHIHIHRYAFNHTKNKHTHTHDCRIHTQTHTLTQAHTHTRKHTHKYTFMAVFTGITFRWISIGSDLEKSTPYRHTEIESICLNIEKYFENLSDT